MFADFVSGFQILGLPNALPRIVIGVSTPHNKRLGESISVASSQLFPHFALFSSHIHNGLHHMILGCRSDWCKGDHLDAPELSCGIAFMILEGTMAKDNKKRAILFQNFSDSCRASLNFFQDLPSPVGK